jgi:hypothetical protein
VSAAYERVRAALNGTALDGAIDLLNAELHLTPDSPEWSLAALGIVGGAALQARLESAERSIVEALDNFPAALRVSAVPIVETLAGDIRQQTVEGVRKDAKSAIIDILTRAIDAHQTIVTDLVLEQTAATKSLTSAAVKAITDFSAAIKQIEVGTSATGSTFSQAAERLAGWSPLRITSISLGAILLAGSFTFGLSWSEADNARTCSARAAAVSSSYHLSARDGDVLRHDICGW